MPDRKQFKKAGAIAKRWLLGIEPLTPEASALREFGLRNCECIRIGSTPPIGHAEPLEILPEPWTMVAMERSELLDLGRKIASSDSRVFREEGGEIWTRIVGGIALSYGRVNDLELVAILVQAAAKMRLKSAAINEAHHYILEQQQPAGCFGLIADEASIIGDNSWNSYTSLRLTVAAVSALASVQAHFSL
jgi:hypothetical protein